MLTYPGINPIAFSLGPIKVHWYGLMYLLGLGLGWILLLSRRQDNTRLHLSAEQIGDLVFYAALGVIIGGRLGYMLFYDFNDFIHAPWIIVKTWEGGMSFHGGLLGVICAMLYFAKRSQSRFIDLMDFIAPVVPLGLLAGRIGNFINGELWGKVSTLPWAMIFPTGGPLPRHPSQLYEALLEGLVLFGVLWCYSRKTRPPFAVSGLFLLGYGLARFTVEFFRVPDAQLGYLAWGWVTMGQILSLPMIFLGLGFIIMAYKRQGSPVVI